MSDALPEEVGMIAQDQMSLADAGSGMKEPPEASGAGVVCLPQELGITQVEACYAQLAEALSTASEVVIIDASALKQIDTAGVQLLYAFVQEAGKKGASISWLESSQELEAVSGQLGLTEGLGF